MKDNWITKKILEFGEVISGGTPSTTVDEFWDGEIVWITPADLSKKQFPEINTSRKKITLQGLNSSSANLIPANSIVMSSRAPIGYFAVPSVDFSTNQGCKSIKLHIGEDSLFHYYNFLFNVEVFKRRGEGTTFAEISKKEVEKLSFTFPEPLPQQQKIAKILSTVDTVIEKTESAIAKYQAIKQGLMHDLFTRGIDINTGQLRPKQQDAPELYKQSALGWIPREWEVITVQEFAGDNNYSIVDGPFGSNLKSIHYRTKGIPIIQSGFVTSNEFIANKYLYVDIEKYYSEIRSSVKAGDIVMAKIGAQCGTCAILPDNHPDGIIAGNCLKITVDKNNNSNFLLNILHLYRMQGKLDLIISTTAQPAISMSSLKKMEIPLPKLKEQNLISEKLNSIKHKIKTEQQALSKYQQLKAGLMQDLLTGRVEVSVN